jgi:hypothetical protein
MCTPQEKFLEPHIQGGVIGTNSGTIKSSYTHAKIDSLLGLTTLDSNTGGFAGANSGLIEKSYSTGDVIARSGSGFVFKNTGTIANSYSTSDVIGDIMSIGFVVFITDESKILNSYSTGTVNENANAASGFAWLLRGEFENVFFNQDKNPTLEAFTQTSITLNNISPSVYEPMAKTTAELQDINTFKNAGWDIQTTNDKNYVGYPNVGLNMSGVGSPWQYYVAPTPTPTTGGGSSTGGDSTPTPSPTIVQEIETETENVDQVIITIVNQEATRPPKIELPVTEIVSIGDIGGSANIGGTTTIDTILSQPEEGQATKRVTMSEAKAMQIENTQTEANLDDNENAQVLIDGGDSTEFRVRLSEDSMIELVDGGVSLPEGVEQEFYVSDEE